MTCESPQISVEGCFCCYVFRALSKEKAYAMALSITKAFYLACQILQEQQGLFPPTPERDKLFEPQRDDDTKVRKYTCTISMYARYVLTYMYLAWQV